MSQTLVLDRDTEALIEEEVVSGRFPDAAAMVKAAVQAFVDQAELSAAEIRRLCDEGDASGDAGTADEVFDRIEAGLRAPL